MLSLRGVRHESEVLVRQVEGRLATLRASFAGAGTAGVIPITAVELDSAERAALRLRELVASTAHASAVDRARVRAAVHYFLGLRNTRSRRPQRTLAEDIRVVNEIVRTLDRVPVPA